MASSAVEAVARALWPAFRRILRQIGGWLVGELVCEGARRLSDYMRIYARKLSGQANDASGPRRGRLRRRARRWARAAAWLVEHARKLSKSAARWFDRWAEQAKIPRLSALEG